MLQNPIAAIVTHPEHGVLYSHDLVLSGFGARALAWCLETVCENQAQVGFSVAEIGAGTGGLTRQVRMCFLLEDEWWSPLVTMRGELRSSLQVVDQLDRNSFKEMHRYVATDITAAFGPSLLALIDNPRLEFKVMPLDLGHEATTCALWREIMMSDTPLHADMGCQRGSPCAAGRPLQPHPGRERRPRL
jgi:hypothetical protein